MILVCTQLLTLIYIVQAILIDANSINIRAREGDTNIECQRVNLIYMPNKDIKLTSDLNGHIKCAGNTQVTAAMIDLNGPSYSGE